MTLAEGIRKYGLRKWYERALVRSHAHLVLTFVSLVGLVATFEAAWRIPALPDRLVDLVLALVLAGVGLWALRRYLRLLFQAERVASQADCPGCKTYARLELLQANAEGNEVQVRCRQCGHGWHISGR